MSAAILAAALLACRAAAVEPAAPPAAPPDLSTAVWANTPGPLPLSTLRGRVVILEFSDPWAGPGERWLMAAQAAQARQPEASVLVSVRTRTGGDESGRGPLEREALRRRILTPMVEDPERALARAYGVETLPAVVLLDARGRFARRLGPPEDGNEIWKQADALVAKARADHDLWTSTGPAAPVWDRYAEGPLAFPTGLAYDAPSDRLAVCDTGHDRVIVADGEGRVRLVAGRGSPEYRDGPAAQAGFDRPRAAAFTGDQLGVADSANDYIRVVELARPRVASWFGNAAGFAWPAALAIADRMAYFGSSGTHQIWAVDLQAERRFLFAGDGTEGDRDGLPPVARLREPAALAKLGDKLYVADPEAQRLRAISVSTPELTTPQLHGPGAPLKRPAALAELGGKLYIADAGDGALKQLDPASGEVLVLARGLQTPSGLAAIKEHLLVAETDASRLLLYSTAGQPLGQLRLRGLGTPPSGPPPPPLPARSDLQELSAQPARAGVLDALEVSFDLPPGMILNPRAPVSARFAETDGVVTVPLEARRDTALPPRQPLRLRFKPAEGSARLTVDVDFFYCRQDRKGLCFAAAKRYRLPVAASAAQKSRVVRVAARP